MYFTLDSGHEIAKCQKNKEWDIRTRKKYRLFASFGLTNKMTSPEVDIVSSWSDRWAIGDRKVPVSSSNKTLFGEKVDFP